MTANKRLHAQLMEIRLNAVEAAVIAYAEFKDGEEPPRDEDDEIENEVFTDLLADMMHWFGAKTFNEVLDRARNHYEEEIKEAKLP